MKFAGLGLKNIVVLWIVLALITLMMKTVLTKHPVSGLSEAVQAL